MKEKTGDRLFTSFIALCFFVMAYGIYTFKVTGRAGASFPMSETESLVATIVLSAIGVYCLYLGWFSKSDE